MLNRSLPLVVALLAIAHYLQPLEAEPRLQLSSPVFQEVPPTELTPYEGDKLDAAENEIKKLVEFYNFDPGSTILVSRVLRCPLFNKRVFLSFVSHEELPRDSSTFNVIIPHQAGPVRLIPLYYRGTRRVDYVPELDPHNVAAFNETVAEERPVLSRETDWVQLAICHLGINGGSRQVLTLSNIVQLMAEVTPGLRPRLLPSVTIASDFTSVQLYEIANDKRYLIEWTFKFSVDGFLRSLGKENRLRAAVLR